MEKGYIEVLRSEIARKFDLALAVQAPKPVSDRERFEQRADQLIREAMSTTR